jgi:hypothetical protein
MLRITTKAAGRFGEHMVQAELERRGWSTCNLNTDHPNAPDYDILAWREETTDKFVIHIQVKASRPSEHRTFLFNTGKGKPPYTDARYDFTVLVGMGENRNEDEFYVLPTSVVGNELRNRWEWYFGENAQRRRQVDAGMIKLYTPGCDLASKWARYRNSWEFTSAGAPHNE